MAVTATPSVDCKSATNRRVMRPVPMTPNRVIRSFCVMLNLSATVIQSVCMGFQLPLLLRPRQPWAAVQGFDKALQVRVAL